jgi:hypothetical protein
MLSFVPKRLSKLSRNSSGLKAGLTGNVSSERVVLGALPTFDLPSAVRTLTFTGEKAGTWVLKDQALDLWV